MSLSDPTSNRLPRSPDVEIQAILSLRIGVLELRYDFPEDTWTRPTVLHADGFVLCRGDITSITSRLRRQKPLVANRRSAIGDAEPLRHVRNLRVDEAGEGASSRASREIVAVMTPAFSSPSAGSWVREGAGDGQRGEERRYKTHCQCLLV